MVILVMASAIFVGVVIVFVGVWMLQSWNGAGRAARQTMLSLLAAASSAVAISVLSVVPAKLLWGIDAALTAFLSCSFLLGLYRVRRERWAQRPEKWPAWLLREAGRALFLPLAAVAVLGSLTSTVALFATMQTGPQPGRALFGWSIVTAACWAAVTVGGVWLRRRGQNGKTDGWAGSSRRALSAALLDRRRW